jgi:adenylate cyclase
MSISRTAASDAVAHARLSFLPLARAVCGDSSQGCSLNKSCAKSKARYTPYWSAIARFASSANVSPQIAEKLLKQPSNSPANCATSGVMFLDIRNFSSFAAIAPPAAVMAHLNTLFDFMIGIVNQHQGIVNKFLGVGFMEVFGAPIDDARQCVHAVDVSREIFQRLDQLNAAGEIHPTRIGIVLYMGEGVTGSGSRQRKEYTIIGDVVNWRHDWNKATKDFKRGS